MYTIAKMTNKYIVVAKKFPNRKTKNTLYIAKTVKYLHCEEKNDHRFVMTRL